jgi:hypothetical protein
VLDGGGTVTITLSSWAISRTSLWKGSFLIRRSVDFWYFLISRRTVDRGLGVRRGFLTPRMENYKTNHQRCRGEKNAVMFTVVLFLICFTAGCFMAFRMR